jgi:hypothetical protein
MVAGCWLLVAGGNSNSKGGVTQPLILLPTTNNQQPVPWAA